MMGDEAIKRKFIRKLRPVCEVIFSVALRAYQQSLDAHCTKSKERARAEDGARPSTGSWERAQIHVQTAIDQAEKAADEARAALNKFSARDFSSPTAQLSNLKAQISQLAISAVDQLKKR
jgi:hypothetical protein